MSMKSAPLTEQANYPTDIFPNICPADLERINRMLMNEMHFPLDRLSAHIAREILAVRIEEEKSAKRLLRKKLSTWALAQDKEPTANLLDSIDLKLIIDECFQIPDEAKYEN